MLEIWRKDETRYVDTCCHPVREGGTTCELSGGGNSFINYIPTAQNFGLAKFFHFGLFHSPKVDQLKCTDS